MFFSAPLRASIAFGMNGFLLGFRGRALSMGLVCFGLAAAAPSGLKGFASFFQAPPGVAVVALALVAIGCSVEETGTIRRIRFGIALRLAAAAVLTIAVVWGVLLGAPLPNLATMGIVLGAVGGTGVVIGLQHDVATYSDVRHGQTVKLMGVSRAGLELEVKGERVTVAAQSFLGATVASNLDGRAVLFLVKADARSREGLEALPWVGATREGDAFVLTEHQASMDAEELAGRVFEMVRDTRGDLVR